MSANPNHLSPTAREEWRRMQRVHARAKKSVRVPESVSLAAMHRRLARDMAAMSFFAGGAR